MEFVPPMTTLSFNFQNVDTADPSSGGQLPTAGAHRARVTGAELKPNSAGDGQNIEVGFATDSGATCRAWFPMPKGINADSDRFVLSKIKRFLEGVGVPAANLQGAFNLDLKDVIGRAIVIFVTPGTYMKDGQEKQKVDVEVVLPADQQSALAGTWTPTTGNKAAGQAPNNGMGGQNMGGMPQNGGGFPQNNAQPQGGGQGFQFGAVP